MPGIEDHTSTPSEYMNDERFSEQERQVLAYLDKHRYITARDAQAMGIMRLASRVSAINKYYESLGEPRPIIARRIRVVTVTGKGITWVSQYCFREWF